MRYCQWPKVLALAGWPGGSFSDDGASGPALDARRRGYRRRGAYEVPRAGRLWLALLAITFCAAPIRRADGAVRQVVSVQTPDAHCTLSYDFSTIACNPYAQALTVTVSPTLGDSKLILLPEWSTLSWNGGPPEGSLGNCTDNLGQTWVYAPFPLLVPPAGGTVAGIPSITCQTAFAPVPPDSMTDRFGVLILHFYEVTGAAAGDVPTVSSPACSVVPAPNAVTILADYTGIVADTYDPNPVFGDFGVLGAYNRGALLMDSDNPSCVYPYCYLDYLILASIHSTVGSAGTTAPIAFPNATQCLTVTIPQTADSGTNLGDCGDDCAKLAGAPINVTNGNVFIKQRDYTLPGLGGGLTLERTWNSLWPLTPHAGTATARMFGDSWTSNFEERLVFVDSQTIDYWRADGSKWRFRYSSTALGADIYNLTAPQGLNADLIYFPPNPLWTNQYTVHIHENLSVREFDPSGVPAGIHDANGNRTSLTHDAQGRVVQVTDAAGRALTFTYGDPTNPTQVTGVADATG